MGAKGTLARQLLGWQLAIVFVLLACVLAVTVVQANRTFNRSEGTRLLSAAENVAATPGVRTALPDSVNKDALAAIAESARSLAGADGIEIAAADRTIVASQDPSRFGTRLDLGDSTVADGRAWVGEVDGSLVAHVPVVDDDATVMGYVAAGTQRPGVLTAVATSPAEGLILLTLAGILGVAGSILLARRVTRQTLGLEPREITGLVEHREAVLHAIKEGVVGLDTDQRITLANDQARELLHLPDDCVGRTPSELGLNERIRDVLAGRARGVDQIVLRAGRVLVINRMPIPVHDQTIGSVATLRDRTELAALRDELDAARVMTDTLRAQAHDFTNRLHTIAGLIELGEYAEVRRYVDVLSHERDLWQEEVATRIDDAAVAALLVAKASLAAEQGVGLRLAADSRLPSLTPEVSADVITVLGNLVDNALDALRGSGHGDRWVEVGVGIGVGGDGGLITVVVRDSGPGVPPELATEVFGQGFTTKVAEHGGGRGLGLALTRQICVRRGGSVDVTSENGAVFTARLRSDGMLPAGVEVPQ